ncbi:hypothetical protein CB1_000243017 [Camelus ferus]|nr:hypothetical protein CB1_000243017 [Camelus ferus]
MPGPVRMRGIQAFSAQGSTSIYGGRRHHTVFTDALRVINSASQELKAEAETAGPLEGASQAGHPVCTATKCSRRAFTFQSYTLEYARGGSAVARILLTVTAEGDRATRGMSRATSCEQAYLSACELAGLAWGSGEKLKVSRLEGGPEGQAQGKPARPREWPLEPHFLLGLSKQEPRAPVPVPDPIHNMVPRVPCLPWTTMPTTQRTRRLWFYPSSTVPNKVAPGHVCHDWVLRSAPSHSPKFPGKHSSAPTAATVLCRIRAQHDFPKDSPHAGPPRLPAPARNKRSSGPCGTRDQPR